MHRQGSGVGHLVYKTKFFQGKRSAKFACLQTLFMTTLVGLLTSVPTRFQLAMSLPFCSHLLTIALATDPKKQCTSCWDSNRAQTHHRDKPREMGRKDSDVSGRIYEAGDVSPSV